MQIRSKAFWVIFMTIFTLGTTTSLCSQDSLILIWNDSLQPDSLRFKAINQYYKKQTFAKPDEVIKLTISHESLAKKGGNEKELAQAYNIRSYAHYLMGDIKNSMKLMKQTISILEKLDDEELLVSKYNNLANILSAQGQHQEAISNYHKCLDLFRKTGKWEYEAKTLNHIGIELSNLEGYDLALKHFEEGLAIYRSKGKLDASGTLLSAMGYVYYHQGKYDLAISTCNEASKLLEKDNNLAVNSIVYFVLAQTYLKKGDKNQAKLYLNKSLEIGKDLNNKSLLIERLIFDAKLSVDDNLNAATIKAEKLLSQLNGDISYNIKAQLYDFLYNCYKRQGKYNKSLEMFEKHKIYSDSVATQKIKIDVMRQVVEKEHKDKLLKQEAESEQIQSELSTKHTIKLISLFLLGLIFIGAIVYFNRNKIIQEKQKTEELLHEIEMLKQKEDKVVGMDKNATLAKEILEKAIDKKLNETDWNVLNILLDDPVISNIDLAAKAYMSVDGIGSSLRRMYEYFDIPNSKYMKIALLLKAIKISNQGPH